MNLTHPLSFFLQEGNPLQRNESDAAALEAKRAAKAAMKNSNTTSDSLLSINSNNKEAVVMPKKTSKKLDKNNLDDLLASGLDAAKKKRAK